MTGPLFTSTKRDNAAVGVSWPLLPLPDANGQLHWPDGPTSIRQSIEVILRTTPGELLMRDGFGAGLERMLGQANTIATRNSISRAVAEAISRYEPRVQLDRIAVSETDEPTKVDVVIAYRIKPSATPAILRATVDVGGA